MRPNYCSPIAAAFAKGKRCAALRMLLPLALLAGTLQAGPSISFGNIAINQAFASCDTCTSGMAAGEGIADAEVFYEGSSITFYGQGHVTGGSGGIEFVQFDYLVLLPGNRPAVPAQWGFPNALVGSPWLPDDYFSLGAEICADCFGVASGAAPVTGSINLTRYAVQLDFALLPDGAGCCADVETLPRPSTDVNPVPEPAMLLPMIPLVAWFGWRVRRRWVR
jgi:hypothetical protein